VPYQYRLCRRHRRPSASLQAGSDGWRAADGRDYGASSSTVIPLGWLGLAGDHGRRRGAVLVVHLGGRWSGELRQLARGAAICRRGRLWSGRRAPRRCAGGVERPVSGRATSASSAAARPAVSISERRSWSSRSASTVRARAPLPHRAPAMSAAIASAQPTRARFGEGRRARSGPCRAVGGAGVYRAVAAFAAGLTCSGPRALRARPRGMRSEGASWTGHRSRSAPMTLLGADIAAALLPPGLADAGIDFMTRSSRARACRCSRCSPRVSDDGVRVGDVHLVEPAARSSKPPGARGPRVAVLPRR